MDWQAFYCLAVLALILIGLALNVASDALLVGAVVLCTVAGVISPQEALAGFSNQAVPTIAAMYVIAAALRQTGALAKLGSWVLGKARSERAVLLRLAAAMPTFSAFLNNTPIVAMFIPIVSDWCKRYRVAPSRLLLPLSYLCILGGTCTLIGTSTNLVVNGLLNTATAGGTDPAGGLGPMSFFELTKLGLPYALVGAVYILIVGPCLLPSRKHLLEQVTDAPREYLVNLQVQPNCPLIGQTVEQAGLRHLPGLFLIEVTQRENTISPVPPDYVLRPNDVLTFTGIVSTVADLEKTQGLVPVAQDDYETWSNRQRRQRLCEAVVSPTCPCIGKTIRDADFRALYNAAVVAVHRSGERLTGKVGDIVLRPGDTLLLRTSPHFVRANRNNPDFLLVGGLEDSQLIWHEKAVWSFFLLALLVILMASGAMQIVTAALLIAALMVLSRCITISDARRSVDWQTLITIGAAFGLARAFENSGLAAVAAAAFVKLAGEIGPYALLAGLFALTSVCTAILTNTAAAALVFPFAVQVADQARLNPRPLIMALVFAASASFISPLGYQTNLMVYGPGGYRFGDFVRVGLPLTILLLICATILIPLLWPFTPA